MGQISQTAGRIALKFGVCRFAVLAVCGICDWRRLRRLRGLRICGLRFAGFAAIVVCGVCGLRGLRRLRFAVCGVYTLLHCTCFALRLFAAFSERFFTKAGFTQKD